MYVGVLRVSVRGGVDVVVRAEPDEPDERVRVPLELRCLPLDGTVCRPEVERLVLVAVLGVTDELPFVRRVFDWTVEEFLDVDAAPAVLPEVRAPAGKFMFVFTVGSDAPPVFSRPPTPSLPPSNTEPSVRR